MKKLRNLVNRNGWWHFRMEAAGKETWISLGVQDETAAAEAAAVLRQAALNERMRARLGLQPQADDTLLAKVGALRRRENYATIEEIETAYLADAGGRKIKERSAANSLSSLKLILRTVYPDRSNINVLSSSILTEQLLTDYQAEKIRAAKEIGPEAEDAALRTAASTINQAKSVFCDEALKSKEMRTLKLSDLVEFKKFKPQGSTRRIRIEVDDLTLEKLRISSDDLWFQAPARWLAFALCGGIGLRRSEAMRAKKSFVREIRGKFIYHVVTGADGAPKGNEHKKEIPASLWNDMKAVMVDGSDFIVPGNAEERERLFDENVQWLRSLGIDVDKPTHELRAMYLQALDRAHGRNAAQLGAGHTDARTTEIYTGRGVAPAVRTF